MRSIRLSALSFWRAACPAACARVRACYDRRRPRPSSSAGPHPDGVDEHAQVDRQQAGKHAAGHDRAARLAKVVQERRVLGGAIRTPPLRPACEPPADHQASTPPLRRCRGPTVLTSITLTSNEKMPSVNMVKCVEYPTKVQLSPLARMVALSL